MKFLESIFEATGFNAFMDYDFRPFILKTFLFCALLAGPFSILSFIFRSAYSRYHFTLLKDRRNKKAVNIMNNPCQYSKLCRNAKPYCFDSDTLQSICYRRGAFECNKSNWHCSKCLHRDEPEICVDCDPFDPPCSLFENSEGWY